MSPHSHQENYEKLSAILHIQNRVSLSMLFQRTVINQEKRLAPDDDTAFAAGCHGPRPLASWAERMREACTWAVGMAVLVGTHLQGRVTVHTKRTADDGTTGHAKAPQHS